MPWNFILELVEKPDKSWRKGIASNHFKACGCESKKLYKLFQVNSNDFDTLRYCPANSLLSNIIWYSISRSTHRVSLLGNGLMTFGSKLSDIDWLIRKQMSIRISINNASIARNCKHFKFSVKPRSMRLVLLDGKCVASTANVASRQIRRGRHFYLR